jgi:hypothetical protein
VKLSSGTTVVLEDLKARQFFKLLRIITVGALPAIQDTSMLRMDPNSDPAEFGARLLSVMVLAIPNAEDQAIDFLRSMVKPHGLIERRGINKQDTERNQALWEALYVELDNPELDDLVTLVEAIVRRESADIQALGKRLAGMLKMAEKTGQIPAPPQQTSPTQTSSVGSVEPSTSSVTSTDGTTSSSVTSLSVDSVSASLPFENGVTTSGGNATSG